MRALTAGQITALENLAEKSAGQQVGWISIEHARTLSELGLAERDRQGWNITPEGSMWLRERTAAASRPDTDAE